jgi:GLPGLI family protein
MKNFIFFSFFLFTIFTYAQSGNAYYKKQLSSSTEDIEDNYMKQAINSLANRQYKLAFNNTEAIYIEVKALAINESPVIEAFVKGLSEFYGEVYFNQLKKSLIIKKEFSGSTFLIEKNQINWVLAKDTIKIDDYVCYKPTTTRIIENSEGRHKLEITAWYAPEISLPYGPDGYGGLPGLILQLNNNGTITALKKLEFFNEAVDINFSLKGKRVTEDEFNSIVVKQYANRKSKY